MSPRSTSTGPTDTSDAPRGARPSRRFWAAVLIVGLVVAASVAAAAPGSGSDRPAPSLTSGSTVTVDSIPALLSTLKDDSIDVIIVKDGTYHVSPSNESAPDSLWIGEDFADRTRPVLVRSETPGGVTFDGGGATGFGGLSFEDGAHHQTWDGFRFANMTAEQSGIIEFGGYTPRTAPHHITLRNITVLGSCRGTATTASGNSTEHAVYFSHASGVGPHDLLVEDLTVDGSGFLASAIHADHGDANNPPSNNVTVRGLRVTGTQNAIILWHPAFHDWLIEDADIKDVLAHAIRFESIGASFVVFKDIVSTNSHQGGFYSSLGADPPGVTFIDNSLD